MKRAMRAVAVLAVLLGCHGLAAAEEIFVKKRPFTLKIPQSFLYRDGVKSGWSSTRRVYAADIDVTASGVAVASDPDWLSAGFPSLIEFAYEKKGYKKKQGYTEVEFRSDAAVTKLRFAGRVEGKLLEEALLQVVASGKPDGPDAKAHLDKAYSLLVERFFTGPLSDLPQETKSLLVRFAHITAGGDLKLNQSQRVAKVMNERLLTILKAFAAPVKDAPNIVGLKLEFGIPHRPFTQKSGNEVDQLQIYALSERIREFAEADITGQALINASVIIVEDNRVEVDLSGS